VVDPETARAQTRPNATKRNQTQPNGTKRNETEPNATICNRSQRALNPQVLGRERPGRFPPGRALGFFGRALPIFPILPPPPSEAALPVGRAGCPYSVVKPCPARSRGASILTARARLWARGSATIEGRKPRKPLWEIGQEKSAKSRCLPSPARTAARPSAPRSPIRPANGSRTGAAPIRHCHVNRRSGSRIRELPRPKPGGGSIIRCAPARLRSGRAETGSTGPSRKRGQERTSTFISSVCARPRVPRWCARP